jgi:tetratricopeptide (TPR) repeat protein
MDAEKFELLEAKIRETALLVARLREEKQRVEAENAQLRHRLDELEEALLRAQDDTSRYVPNIDTLLQQLDTLQDEESLEETAADTTAAAFHDLQAREDKGPEAYLELGKLHEGRNQLEQAIEMYQNTLRIDSQNLEAAQRLAFLLEKLNRDTEAAPLWDKIWAMQEAQANPRRRRQR